MQEWWLRLRRRRGQAGGILCGNLNKFGVSMKMDVIGRRVTFI